jgi:hypothetical protein
MEGIVRRTAWTTALLLGLLCGVSMADTAELGKLSEKYESGGRGPETVSTGKGDLGGVSYGTYQLASKVGRADEFVRKYYPVDFKGLKGGTPAFTARWKEVVRRDPKAFRANEHRFIKETHFDILVGRLSKGPGLVATRRSRALRDVLWSTAVQHGPYTTVVEAALRPVLKSKNVDELSDEEIIRAVYAERGRKDGRAELVYFRGNSPEVQAAVASRFVNELRDALAALRKETDGKK